MTLCGSTKFKDVFELKAAEMSWRGKIVLKPEVYTHWYNGELSQRDEQFLDDLHKDKIRESDEIYVVNPFDYIGRSTKSEVEFAIQRHIPVTFMQMPSRKHMSWIELHAKRAGAKFLWCPVVHAHSL